VQAANSVAEQRNLRKEKKCNLYRQLHVLDRNNNIIYMKDTWLIIMGMFIALGVAGGGVGMFFGLFKPTMDAKNILKTGDETTANIIRLNSSMSKGNQRYYFLEISFRNAKGEEIRVKTNSLYSEKFIVEQGIASKNETTRKYDVIEKETVQVMYKGNKAVLKGFVPDEDEKWLWLVPVVFGLIGIGIFIVCLFAFMNALTLSKIKKHGVSGTGIYLKHETATSKGVTTYNICFTFENRDGKYVEVQTGYNYADYEAETLMTMQKFPIRYEGNKAVIMVDKSEFLQFKATKTLHK
jgi:hypothetical protein